MPSVLPTDLWPIKPMLARRAEEPFDSKDFIYELKWDGTRCIAYIENGVIRLQNRRLIDITYRYPEFEGIPGSIRASNVILDGEIVVLQEGIPDFKRLQSREQTDDTHRIAILSRLSPALFVVFDLLFLEDGTYFDRPLEKRRKSLEGIIEKSDFIILSEGFDQGTALFKEAVRRGFEGIMAKEIHSTYQPGIRSPSWLKIKKSLDLDAIVCGWLESEKRGFSSLILGLYSGNRLIHIGQVGTGFTDEEMKVIKAQLKKLRTSTPPLDIDIPAKERIRWVRPQMVVRVSAMQWTSHGRLRAPVFIGIRPDKSPEECTDQQ